MLYYLAKAVMWPALQIYFRRIYYVGRGRVPTSGPLILISNHSASFLDAIVTGTLLNRSIYFFARNDVFRNPLAARVLRSLHMIPVYNIEYGRGQMHRNEESFSKAEALLVRNRAIQFFPEGLSRKERTVLPLKKGIARIAQRSVQRLPEKVSLTVVPLGINFLRHGFRSDLLLVAGEPTDPGPFFKEQGHETNKQVLALTGLLQERLHAAVIHVDQAERTDLLNQLLELGSREPPEASGFHPSDFFWRRQQEIASKVSGWTADQCKTKEGLLKQYEKELKAARYTDRLVTHGTRPRGLHFLILIVLSPLLLPAVLLGAPPMLLASWLARKTVTREDFHTSVLLTCGAFLGLAWWIVLVVLALNSGNTALGFVAFLSPICLYLACWWWEAFQEQVAAMRVWWRGDRGTAELQRLKNLRKQLMT